MGARATFGGTQVTVGMLRIFVLALAVALLVGGAGGYIFRAMTFSASTTDASPTRHRATDIPLPGIEQEPYLYPSPSPSQPTIYDPQGNPIPV